MKILIVDDNIHNQKLLKSVLKAGGYTDTHTFSSPIEVFEYFGMSSGQTIDDKGVDLILMDLMMPEVDGITATNRIKETTKLRDILVIMVTANTDMDSLQRSFDAGAMDYINKPYENIEIITRVKSAIRLKKEMDRRKQREEELLKLKLQLEAKNKELDLLSSMDGLTGVFNRRVFEETLTYEWRRTSRESEYISLILLDIDEFKKYNDTYGHQTGDDCLRKVATELKRTLHRTGDSLFRYGGEEFVVVLPNTNPAGAFHVAEALRLNIEHLEIPHLTSTVSKYVTISIGISTLLSKNTVSQRELIEVADRALYEAKNSGRNQIKAYTPAWHDVQAVR